MPPRVGAGIALTQRLLNSRNHIARPQDGWAAGDHRPPATEAVQRPGQFVNGSLGADDVLAQRVVTVARRFVRHSHWTSCADSSPRCRSSGSAGFVRGTATSHAARGWAASFPGACCDCNSLRGNCRGRRQRSYCLIGKGKDGIVHRLHTVAYTALSSRPRQPSRPTPLK